MDFRKCMETRKHILMEGALGERLKREYNLIFDEHVVMAGLIYEETGAFALKTLWNEYIKIAFKYNLPFREIVAAQITGIWSALLKN